MNPLVRLVVLLCGAGMLLAPALTLMRCSGPALVRPGEPRPLAASISVTDALRGTTDGYAQAIEPRLFAFPDDHGPHPHFRTEWWYYTGNLSTGEGRRFGFQLTFFRIAQGGAVPDRPSKWAASQVYMAHFA